MARKNLTCCGILIGLLLVDCASTVNQVVGQAMNRSIVEQSEDLFLPAPRSLQRLLREAEVAIAEQRFSDAVDSLGSLLIEPPIEPNLSEINARQDYFQPLQSKETHSSLRTQALRMMGELPAEGRKLMEIRYGVTARQKLQQAMAVHDFDAIGEVARDFYHTDAGYDAIRIIAYERLTQGFPLAAAVLLTRLTEFPHARERYGAKLFEAVANCWLRCQRPLDAAKLLEQATKHFPGQKIRLISRDVELSPNTEWSTLLADQREDQWKIDHRFTNSWTMTGGAPDRNASTKLGMPIPTEKWAKSLHGSESVEQSVLHTVERSRARGQILLPSIEARMVSDLLMVKSSNNFMMAIDFETGLLKWPYYFDSFNNAPYDLFPNRTYETADGTLEAPRELLERVLGRTSFGQFSCDANHIYFVTAANQQVVNSRNLLAPAQRFRSEAWNYLEGVSIAREGAIEWRVGGEKGDDPALAHAFFLGPPTPFEGDLYAIAEINGETRLVVLDSANGKLIWSQQLIHSPNSSISNDQRSQFQSISPSIADGIIVCPTGHGALVALDLLSRNLLWARHYAPQRIPASQFGLGTDFAIFDVMEERWTEPFVVMHRGAVLAATPEDAEIRCFDLLTGNLLWSKTRGQGRIVSGIHNDSVIVVGNNSISSFQVWSGESTWTTNVLLQQGEFVAGKPARQDGILLVPTTLKRVLRVDLSSGQIAGVAEVDRQLGNLFAYQNQLVSVSPTDVSVFYTQEYLSTVVEQRLAANAEDTWGLNQKAQLEIANQRIDSAMQFLEKSFSLDSSNEETRYLLVRSLLRGLEVDPERYQPMADRLERSIQIGRQKFEFLVGLAKSNIRRGQHQQAFDRLFQLLHTRRFDTAPQTQKRLDRISVDVQHDVDADAWIAAELSRSFFAANPTEQANMLTVIEAELERASKLPLSTQREWLNQLRWLPAAHQAISDLARQFLQNPQQTSGERLLQPILAMGSLHAAAEARQLLGKQSLVDRTKLQAIDSNAIELLDRRAPSNPAQEVEVPKEIDEEVAWPRGMAYAQTGQENLPMSAGNPVGISGQRYGRPSISVRAVGSSVFVFNQFGNRAIDLLIERSSMENNDAILRGYVDGSILILETQTELVALDLNRGDESPSDSMLWRHSLSSAGPARTRMPISSSPVEENSLGLRPKRREFADGRDCWVGPITPAGIAVKKGSEVVMLDLQSGDTIWKRSGLNNKVALAAQGLELAVIDTAAGFSRILDCRDGAAKRQVQYRGDWQPWISFGPIVVEFASKISDTPSDGIHHSGNLPMAMRLVHALTGKVLAEKEFEAGSRAAVCEDQYFVLIEPKGKMWFCDFSNPKLIERDIQSISNLKAISLQSFRNRLLVLTNCSTVYRPLNPNSFLVNGPIWGLDRENGFPIWQRSGKLHQFIFAMDQPRGSPMATFYRQVRGQNDGQAAVNGGIAVVDTRSGRLVYGTSSRKDVQENRPAQVELEPANSTLNIFFGTQVTKLSFTDDPIPPQPVCHFGFVPTTSDVTKPFSFDLFSSPEK